jgi:hypothetical protein
MKRRRAQGGFSLMIAVSVTMLLSLAGLLVLQQAATDVQMEGADQVATRLRYVADVGATWGPIALGNLLYPGGWSPGAADQASAIVANLKPLSPALYPIFCPENYCASPPCAGAIDCSAFFALGSPTFVNHPTQGAPGNKAPYVAGVVSCSPACVTGVAKLYRIRSFGSQSVNSRVGRLMEVDVAPQ